MELIAAIDLVGGRSVRLRQGDFGRPIGGGDPLERARSWAAAGVPRLHVVDLDGARAGRPSHLATLAAIIAAARTAAPRVRIQAAGGLRTPEAAAAALDAGADAIVLGTAALEQPGFLAGCAARWPGRVFAAMDVRDGRPVVAGWLRSRDDEPLEAAARLLGEGAAGLLVTDTRQDGELGGPNVALLTAFRERFPATRLIAAGGVRSTDDLLSLRRIGLDGVIVGMALVTGVLAVADALTALEPDRRSA